MKKGDKVMIYLDPFTREKPEGVARIAKIEYQRENETHALVVFDGDKEKYFRIIYT